MGDCGGDCGDCGGDCGDCGGDCGDCGDCDNCGDCEGCGECMASCLDCKNCNCRGCQDCFHCEGCDICGVECCQCDLRTSCDCLKSCDCFKSCDCCGLECDCSCFKSCDILSLCGCRGEDGTCSCFGAPSDPDHPSIFRDFFCFCCSIMEEIEICCFAASSTPSPPVRTSMPQQQVMHRGETVKFATPISKSDATIGPNTMDVSTIAQETANAEVDFVEDIDKTDKDPDVIPTTNPDTTNVHDTTVDPQMINVDT